jgi:hypothetical protein
MSCRCGGKFQIDLKVKRVSNSNRHNYNNMEIGQTDTICSVRHGYYGDPWCTLGLSRFGPGHGGNNFILCSEEEENTAGKPRSLSAFLSKTA